MHDGLAAERSSFFPQPAPRAPASRRRVSSVRLVTALAIMLLLVASPPARAQGGILAQGVIDAEMWKTDSMSVLLARNGGRPGAMARLGFWAAVEPWRDVVVFGQLSAETGPGRREEGSEIYVTQYGTRWSPSDAFVVEAGKMSHVVGTFSSRHLSFRNPLIGAPDGYSLVYPFGVKVSGSASVFDWRIAALSKPLTHEGYTVDPSPAVRPAIGAGITPFTGFRLGASATVGPYLTRDLAPTLLAGRSWRSYQQRLVAADMQLSRGYFESFAELAHGSYDVPGGERKAGLTWYVETKYTFTPRLYGAVRVERNDYPYIMPLNDAVWIADKSDFTDVEAGAGVRLTSSTLLKLSVRADHWVPNPNPFAPQSSGRALAVQLSRTFDVMEMARPLRLRDASATPGFRTSARSAGTR